MKTKEFMRYQEDLETYVTHVNTDVLHKMKWEDELYASYGYYHGLEIHDLKNWYKNAEDDFISVWGLDLYIMNRYDTVQEEDINYLIDKEIDAGRIYQVNDYWFEAN